MYIKMCTHFLRQPVHVTSISYWLLLYHIFLQLLCPHLNHHHNHHHHHTHRGCRCNEDYADTESYVLYSVKELCNWTGLHICCPVECAHHDTHTQCRLGQPDTILGSHCCYLNKHLNLFSYTTKTQNMYKWIHVHVSQSSYRRQPRQYLGKAYGSISFDQRPTIQRHDYRRNFVHE